VWHVKNKKWSDHQGFSLRQMINLTTLTNEQFIQRAIDYMKCLQSQILNITLSKTILIDETAVYAWTQMVEITGCKHMVMKSTGFASMRIIALISIWADGQKAPPTIIHNGGLFKDRVGQF
jgi:hypothetical protein